MNPQDPEVVHVIRLRGGWTTLDANREVLTLPIVDPLPNRSDSLLQIQRKFGKPSLKPNQESLRLVVENVPGLVALRLNGQDLVHDLDPLQQQQFRFPGPFHDRNTLELVADLRSWLDNPFREPWGVVALEIILDRGSCRV